MELIEDPAHIDLYGKRTLLMHGDTLCTGDTAYLAFRAQVRDPAWQRAALARPIGERLAMAQGLRAESEGAKQGAGAQTTPFAPSLQYPRPSFAC